MKAILQAGMFVVDVAQDPHLAPERVAFLFEQLLPSSRGRSRVTPPGTILSIR